VITANGVTTVTWRYLARVKADTAVVKWISLRFDRTGRLRGVGDPTK
jgi:hypothetical protein